MKSRIFLLAIAFQMLAGALTGQTSAQTSTPAAQNSPAAASPAVSTPPSQTPARAQNPPKSESDESFPTIVHEVNEVRVLFTVTDRHGRYVKDLKSSDFRVMDDQKPAELRSFNNETDLPLQVGLLVDASNSVRDRFKFEQEAAIEFLNSIIRPRYDKAFVVGFDATPEVTQDFTDSTEGLSAGRAHAARGRRHRDV